MLGQDFAKDVEINRFKLEEECERHVSLYHFYSEKLAQSKATRDEQKALVRLMEAKKELGYRENPVGNLKSTDKSVAAMVAADEDLASEKAKLRKKEKDVYIFEAAVSDIEHRKRMLDNLVQLYCKGYYSKPGEHNGNKPNDDAQVEGRKQLNKRKKKKEK